MKCSPAAGAWKSWAILKTIPPPNDSLAAGATAFVNMPSAAGSSELSQPQNRQLPPARILIVRLGAMGDVIHGLPAVAALRAVFPGSANLGWLIEERWAELLCTLPTPRSGPRSPQRPLVDRIHTVNTKQWRASPFSLQTWERIAAGLSDLRAEHYDVAIDLQGAVRSSLLARWSGAPVILWIRPASRKPGQHVLHPPGDRRR